MTTFTLWPPDTHVFDGPTVEVSRSSTLVQFAIGACMLVVRHLVQRLIGFSGIETGRALMIGNLVPALEGLLTAFGGMRLGIGSTPPRLLLDSGSRHELPVVSPLTWKATECVSSRALSVFDLRDETVMGMAFVSGCMLLAMLAGAWIIRARISVTRATTDADGSLLIPSKNICSSANEGSKTGTGNDDSAKKDDARTRRRGGDPTGHRHSEPHGDERKHDRASDSDDDSDDEDPPPPPPGPGTGLGQDDDTGEGGSTSWKHLGLNFMLGYLVVAILKGLRRLKRKSGAQKRHNGFGIDEKIGGSDYGKEWDVLEGTYGFSRSKSNVDMTAKPLPELSGDFRITVRAIPLAIFSANYAQNQTIPAFVSARNSRQKINWARLSRIKAAVTVTIQICLDMFLEMFGLVDFVVTVVIPLFIAVLRYRYDEQDASAEMDDLSTEANKLVESGQGPSKRQEDDEDFVYLNQRLSAPPNVLESGNNPEQFNISTPWSSPRRTMERCSTHYSDLAGFIARHACEQEDLDGNSEKDVCVSMTEEGGSSDVANIELAHETSRSSMNYADETATELTSFDEERHATDSDPDSEWSYGEDLYIDGECEDAEELLDELSDVESYVTAEGSDVGKEITIHDEKPEGKPNGRQTEMESLYEPFSELESMMCIDDSSTDDELGDPTRSFPGSFPVPFRPQMLGQIPLWGTRGNQWSIFAQFEELREGGPLLASEAIDFGLPRSNPSLVESQTNVKVDSFRTPPRANTVPSTPPAVPRGRNMSSKEKEMREGREGNNDPASPFPVW